MLIYCNGDSFTAGVNLCDHIFPEFPGYFTKDELTTRAKEIKKFAKIKSRHCNDLYIEYNKVLAGEENLQFHKYHLPGLAKLSGCHNKLEKKYSYPLKITELDSSIKVINAAIPGASMGGICNRTIVDLLSLKESNTRVDRVVIQLTSPLRYEIYDYTRDYLMYDRPLGQFQNDEDNRLSDAVAIRYTRHDYIIKFLYHLVPLTQIVTTITGTPPIYIDSINGEHINDHVLYTENYIQNNNNKNFSVYESLVNQSKIKEAHFNYMKKFSEQVKKPFSYDGHFSEEVHTLTAKGLLTLL